MKIIVSIASILRIIFITVIIGFAVYANAQNVAINTNGAAADASAMLDVSSTSKGFLPPRMTTIQRAGIQSPTDGLMVFDSDTKSYWYYSTAWKEIPNASPGSFSLPYSGNWTTNFNVFSINNTGVNDGSSAIYGKSGVGAGAFNTPFSNAGVWGENTLSGYGVLGTSSGGNGIGGFSKYGTGVYGFTYASNSPGVLGSNKDSSGVGVMGYLQNGGTSLWGINYGKGTVGRFESFNGDNTDPTVYILGYGNSQGLTLAQANSTTTSDAAFFHNEGLGHALNLQAVNLNSTSQVLRVGNSTKGTGLYVENFNASNSNYVFEGWQSGIGGGIFVQLSNANGTGSGLVASTKGTGTAVAGHSDKGISGYFGNSTTTNSSVGLEGYTNGTGGAGYFHINNSTNVNAVLSASSSGTGPGLVIDNTNANAVTSLATFKKNGVNKARIDGTGKGYFNGGTQSSGADVAEAFDVTGDRNVYEAGDVLIISTDKDRAVERSSQPYSTLVAGVYATKPGVLLTEENIDTDISDKVPMGVVGVIPTKVCLEGGEIKRGDLLVTSSIPGVAMKADIEKVKPGQVIGKALENFNSSSVEKIKVLVNVK